MSRIFGAIRQNGYVVKDIEAAMRHWSEVMGVGPWFYNAHVPLLDFTYKGTPAEPDVSVAFSNSGMLQIELIQQRNDAPTLFLDFLKAGHEGLQHVAYWTENYEADRAKALALGYKVGHEGSTGKYGPFVYFQTESHPGTIVELSAVVGIKKRLFAHIAEAAANWDGKDPIRPFPKVD
ncbi:MAG: VOC family protein [Alphaproteobacteria bacterium]